MNDKILRENVVELLRGRGAHVAPDAALAGVNPKLRNTRPAGGLHSIWEDLEHMRLAQEDILRYTIDPEWKSPDWPAGYWPGEVAEVTDAIWEESLRGFWADLEEVISIAADESRDLTASIPHGEAGHTYLRELLLVADHNAYHIGQVVQTRRLLGDWNG